MAIKFQLKDYKAETHPDWCPGCGDFGILNAIQSSLFELELDPNNVADWTGYIPPEYSGEVEQPPVDNK